MNISESICEMHAYHAMFNENPAIYEFGQVRVFMWAGLFVAVARDEE